MQRRWLLTLCAFPGCHSAAIPSLGREAAAPFDAAVLGERAARCGFAVALDHDGGNMGYGVYSALIVDGCGAATYHRDQRLPAPGQPHDRRSATSVLGPGEAAAVGVLVTAAQGADPENPDALTLISEQEHDYLRLQVGGTSTEFEAPRVWAAADSVPRRLYAAVVQLRARLDHRAR